MEIISVAVLHVTELLLDIRAASFAGTGRSADAVNLDHKTVRWGAARPTDGWADDLGLSDVEHRFVYKRCGRRGADIRPDFDWNGSEPAGGMGFRKFGERAH